jgi:ubiquitin-like-conjugating enzyme ATG3
MGGEYGLYLTTCLMAAPCPRRATALVYTDAEEDAERLVSMEGGSSKEDEWVQTHAGRGEYGNLCFTILSHTSHSLIVAAPTSHPDAIEDIPDDDALAADLQHMNIKSGDHIPAVDEIPDMEEDDLEDAMNSNIIQAPKPV